MSDWTRNNRAHGYTYLALRVLDYVPKGFAAAGDLRMNQLGHWVPGMSAQDRKRASKATASIINNQFMLTYGAKYETGFNATKSVKAMADVLANPNRKLKSLANVADSCYFFKGEILDE
jgi:hypothetical protein